MAGHDSRDIKKQTNKQTWSEPSARPCEALMSSDQMLRGVVSLQDLSRSNLSIF